MVYACVAYTTYLLAHSSFESAPGKQTGLLAKAQYQSTSPLNVLPPSRASPLPHEFLRVFRSSSSGYLFRRLPFTLRHQFAGQGDEAFAVVDGVVEWVEAADQERGDTQVVVIQQSFGHLFRGADQ